MNTHHTNTTVDAEGSIVVRDLPFEEGDEVEVFVVRRPTPTSDPSGTANALRSSPLAGLWTDRSDLRTDRPYTRAS
jgi:hypothetical protein